MTLEEARREFLAEYDSMVECAAQRVVGMSGAPIEDVRDTVQDLLWEALSKEMQFFLMTGSLPIGVE